MPSVQKLRSFALSTSALCLMAGLAQADIVHLDDVIVDGSICVGQDCVNGESFGFDTIRLKENNLRIKFQDTSTAASFPSNDWELKANASANGGDDMFGIVDVDAGRTLFQVFAGAPNNALVVDSQGDVGLGVINPVVDLHVRRGDTPAMRLEQDGSSGFAPQTWDVAGNETNFFIRDVTNGSQLPLRIRPGADSNSIFVDVDNDVGMGTSSPDASLHVRRTDGTAQLLIEEASGTEADRDLMKLVNNGKVGFLLEDTSVAAGDNTGREWSIKNNNGNLRFTTAPAGVGELEMQISVDGDLSISGDFISSGSTLNVPDYVFADDYELRPLSEVSAFITANSHLPDVPSAAEIGASGLNMGEMQMTLLRKIEELTLYTLEQEGTIRALSDRVSELEG